MGAIENAVEVAVDRGLEIPVEVLDRMGGGLNAGVCLTDGLVGVGDGLSDEVDIDKDRRVAPKV